jgi:TonB family protein
VSNLDSTVIALTFSSALNLFLRAYVAWRDFRVSLALVFSLFLHTMVLVALMPSSGISTGIGETGLQPQSIYAVLTPTVFTVELQAAPSLAVVVAVLTNGDMPVLAESTAQESVVSVKKNEVRDVAPLPPPEATKTTEIAAPGLPPAPGYKFGVGLHRQPRLLNDIQPEYPSAAGVRDGIVFLRILVSETGAIDNLAVVRAEPTGFFENAALEAFARAEFSPGEFLGVPVKSQFFVELEFIPINRGRASGRGY